MSITIKKKICKCCKKECFIFSKGNCKNCSNVLAIKKPIKVKAKPKPISKLKKELDSVFSLFIRHKNAKGGLVECYTCGVVKPIKEMQNGHFHSRSNLATRFLEINCKPQCVRCNIFLNGNYIIFTRKMQKELGENKFNKLGMLAKASYSISNFEYELMIKFYKEEIEKL